MKVRLDQANRERFGAPELIDMDDVNYLSGRDALLLEEHGIEYSPTSLAKNLSARIWLGLHRAGITVTAEDLLDLNIFGIRSESESRDEVDPGKASEPDSAPTSPI